MKWIRERDALIAQTLAFVQSVSGRKDDFRQPDTAAAAEIASVQAVTIAFEPPQADPPRQIAPTPQPLPAPSSSASDFRSEMQARIARFRKHQERFEREREDYCAATLTKLRAAIRDAAPPPK
ncbi:hypothetical protein [Bradyrhizobium guangdongense]|uniref:Uncharacterized protein n=1 Tax=Bradyrhizobium guangdongense TaxID=1325090 RepID=A0A410V5P9_9BRAD|nr:hypothetical protein [Bradyrhizobium guangdongense]QAU39023.1 hypothetical protein X265_16085 [Bradyrhizobium guangdongense]QOZ60078.1 hypothetical protein XH86_16090 [Bradyrhizobium guangdongense]GGI23578.1 hypothetical protein GCM10010987_25100 [Bradyrhizobium guangdongense]